MLLIPRESTIKQIDIKYIPAKNRKAVFEMTNRNVREKIDKLCKNNLRQAETNANEYGCHKVMKEFRELYKKCKPDKTYKGLHHHYKYLIRLIPLWRAFEKNNYVLALHELNTLISYDDILSGESKDISFGFVK